MNVFLSVFCASVSGGMLANDAGGWWLVAILGLVFLFAND